MLDPWKKLSLVAAQAATAAFSLQVSCPAPAGATGEILTFRHRRTHPKDDAERPHAGSQRRWLGMSSTRLRSDIGTLRKLVASGGGEVALFRAVSVSGLELGGVSVKRGAAHLIFAHHIPRFWKTVSFISVASNALTLKQNSTFETRRRTHSPPTALSIPLWPPETSFR